MPYSLHQGCLQLVVHGLHAAPEVITCCLPAVTLPHSCLCSGVGRGLECLRCANGKEGSQTAHSAGGYCVKSGEGGQVMCTQQGESQDACTTGGWGERETGCTVYGPGRQADPGSPCGGMGSCGGTPSACLASRSWIFLSHTMLF